MQNLSVNEIVEHLKNKLESKNLEKVKILTKALEREKENSRKKTQRNERFLSK